MVIDGDSAIASALADEFPDTKVLEDFRHFKENVLEVLRTVSPEPHAEFQRCIQPLVDAPTYESFDDTFKRVQPHMSERLLRYLQTGDGPAQRSVLSRLKCKTCDHSNRAYARSSLIHEDSHGSPCSLADGVSFAARREAGFTDPKQMAWTQANESLHHMIRQGMYPTLHVARGQPRSPCTHPRDRQVHADINKNGGWATQRLVARVIFPPSSCAFGNWWCCDWRRTCYGRPLVKGPGIGRFPSLMRVGGSICFGSYRALRPRLQTYSSYIAGASLGVLAAPWLACLNILQLQL